MIGEYTDIIAISSSYLAALYTRGISVRRFRWARIRIHYLIGELAFNLSMRAINRMLCFSLDERGKG